LAEKRREEKPRSVMTVLPVEMSAGQQSSLHLLILALLPPTYTSRLHDGEERRGDFLLGGGGGDGSHGAAAVGGEEGRGGTSQVTLLKLLRESRSGSQRLIIHRYRYRYGIMYINILN
jgi:hypothetical protein